MNGWRKLSVLGGLAMGLVVAGCDSPFPSDDSSLYQARGKGSEAGKPESESKGKPSDLKACPETGTTVLYGGQHIEVGYVDASIADGKLTVKMVGMDWTFAEVHIDAAASPEGLSGPPGTMMHNSGRLENVSEYTAVIDLSGLDYESGAPLYVATHAVVHGTREGQEASETAWGYGTRYGLGWAWYFSIPNPNCQGGGSTGTGTGPTGGESGSTGTGGSETGDGTDGSVDVPTDNT